jgi:hypothetical protein
MWIAFRFDEGDFLLPFAGREVRAQEQNHQPKTLESGSLLPEPSISKLMDSKMVMELFKCLNLPMKIKITRQKGNSL